ncbi:hypothetical protein [Levilactobacillus spicheri]|uniref:Antitoxin n=1 Tax=Levilactobacillus spicheri TaxID=216463 RepID=A0A0F3RTE3_9LACO|nr:hypothetical protein [Levilactobacillus spicheri]KJW13273.1 hypothetical protein VC81_02045 [Levilactobacillus spicheri]
MKVPKIKDVSLKFTNDQYQRIKAMADFHGVAVTTYLRTTILTRTADDTDYRDAMANLKASCGETVSNNDIRQRLGLE